MASQLSELAEPLARKPGLIVFDLDYTLWPLWIDTHSAGGPYKYDKSTNSAIDRRGGRIALFPDVIKVFGYIKDTLNVPIAIASRTHTPDRATAVLSLLKLEDGTTMADAIVHPQIYPRSKLHHMKALERATGVRCEDMLFFDDESRNEEVESLGVTFVLVDEDEGVTEEAFHRGLKAFAQKRRETKMKDDDADTGGKRPRR